MSLLDLRSGQKAEWLLPSTLQQTFELLNMHFKGAEWLKCTEVIPVSSFTKNVFFLLFHELFFIE